MPPATQSQITATLDDLAEVEGKAELVAGKVVRSMPGGDAPTEIAFEIAIRLREFARETGRGVAFPDGIGYALKPPLANGRQSFSPDASYHVGPRPKDRMRFIEGPPALAVEVRSQYDYGPKAEAERAEKRADYFEAGTLVVWDVAPVARAVLVYRAGSARSPDRDGPGEDAEAEPATPGWRPSVDDILPAP